MTVNQYLELGKWLLLGLLLMLPSILSYEINNIINYVYSNITVKNIDKSIVQKQYKDLINKYNFIINWGNPFSMCRCEHNNISMLYVHGDSDSANEKDTFLCLHEISHVIRQKEHEKLYTTMFGLLSWVKIDAIFTVIFMIVAFLHGKFSNPIWNLVFAIGVFYYIGTYAIILIEEILTNKQAKELYSKIDTGTSIMKQVQILNVLAHIIDSFINISAVFTLFILIGKKE